MRTHPVSSAPSAIVCAIALHWGADAGLGYQCVEYNLDLDEFNAFRDYDSLQLLQITQASQMTQQLNKNIGRPTFNDTRHDAKRTLMLELKRVLRRFKDQTSSGDSILPWALVVTLSSVLGCCCCCSVFRERLDARLVEKVAAAKAEAESPEVEWLNKLVSLLWPKINVYVKELMTSIVQPAINDALPRAVRGTVVFGEVSLGDARPAIGPIKVRERGADTIVVDIKVNMDLNIEFSLRALGMNVNVHRILVCGEITIVFRPLQTRPPFFGGLEVYFANAPKLDLDFGGLAEVAEYPGLRGIIRGALIDLLHRFLVLPSRVAVDLNAEDDIDIAELRFPEPLGVLRLTMENVINITGNGCFSPMTPDLYAVVKMGNHVVKIDKLGKSGAKVGNDGATAEFLLYDKAQLCDISVCSSAVMCKDRSVGEVKDVPLNRFAHDGFALKTALQLRGQDERICGSLNVSSQMFTLSQSVNAKGSGNRAAQLVDGRSQLLLLAKVVNVSGLPKDSVPPFKVRLHCAAGKFEAISRGSYPKRGGLGAARKDEDICEELGKHGMTAEQIGKVLGLGPDLVNNIIEARREPDEVKRRDHMAKWRKSVNDDRAVNSPHWNETLQLLLPWNETQLKANVTLELLDKNDKRIGNGIEVALESIFQESSQELQGPFEMSSSVVMEATLRARWLRNV